MRTDTIQYLETLKRL